jgi:hypothetical protein
VEIRGQVYQKEHDPARVCAHLGQQRANHSDICRISVWAFTCLSSSCAFAIYYLFEAAGFAVYEFPAFVLLRDGSQRPINRWRWGTC